MELASTFYTDEQGSSCYTGGWIEMIASTPSGTNELGMVKRSTNAVARLQNVNEVESKMIPIDEQPEIDRK
jgi:hypothetical protein